MALAGLLVGFWPSGIAYGQTQDAGKPAGGGVPAGVVGPATSGGPAPSTTSRPDRAMTRAGRQARRAQAGNLIGHGGPVKAVASDLATGRVLTGSFDYSLMAWDVRGDSAAMLHRFAAFEGAVNAVAFVPGGDAWIAGGDDQGIWLGGFDGKAAAVRLSGHTGKINAVAVSADGRYAVSASWDRTARIWDLAERKAGAVLAGHTGPVNAAVFSGDGSTIYTASYDGSVVAWRRTDGTRLRTVLKHGWGVNVLARVPDRTDDALVFGGVDGAVGVIDGRSGEALAALDPHKHPVLALAVVAKPGLLAVGSGDGTIRIVRLGDWSLLHEFTNTFGPIWALAFVADGTALYYGGLDDYALRWQIDPRAAFEPIESKFPRRFQVATTASDGERQFARKCSVCHTLTPNDRNRAGPNLYGIFGRRAGTLPGYPYSDALKGSTIVWSEETVAKLFELGPDHYTPGSKMPLQKITDAATRNALIAYLKVATTATTSVNPAGSKPAGVQE